MTEIDIDGDLYERLSENAGAHGYDSVDDYVEDVLYRHLDGVGGVGQ